MSTKEIALSILNQMNESQLEGFVALFGGAYSKSRPSEKINADNINQDKAAAFERIEQIKKKIKPLPAEFDERAEYLSYMDERYGV